MNYFLIIGEEMLKPNVFLFNFHLLLKILCPYRLNYIPACREMYNLSIYRIYFLVFLSIYSFLCFPFN